MGNIVMISPKRAIASNTPGQPLGERGILPGAGEPALHAWCRRRQMKPESRLLRQARKLARWLTRWWFQAPDGRT